MTIALTLFYLAGAYGLLVLRSPTGLIQLHKITNKPVRASLQVAPEALASLSYVLCLFYGGMALDAWGPTSIGPAVVVWSLSLSYHLAWIYFFTECLNLGGIKAKPVLWRFTVAQILLGSWVLYQIWRNFYSLAETNFLTF